MLGATGPANLAQNVEARRIAADAFADRLLGLFAGFRARKLSQRLMVDELNRAGVCTACGGKWSLVQVQHLLARLVATSSAGPFSTAAPNATTPDS